MICLGSLITERSPFVSLQVISLHYDVDLLQNSFFVWLHTKVNSLHNKSQVPSYLQFMVIIFSWDPSSRIIFLHVALGEGGVGGGGGGSVFSRFRRSFLDTLSRHDAAKRPRRETTLSGNDR